MGYASEVCLYVFTMVMSLSVTSIMSVRLYEKLLDKWEVHDYDYKCETIFLVMMILCSFLLFIIPLIELIVLING